MRIHHQFGEADNEVITTVIPLHDAKGMDITLQAGPFEHFFLIVKDPQHRMRALLTWKTRIKQYQIRETFTDGSNNTLPGKIMAGEWSFTVVKPGRLCGEIAYDIHCCSEVKENGQTHAVAVLDKPWNDVVNPRSGWYRGDLHAHSEYSDGRVSLQHISRRATEQHLDFLALTDHSIVTTHFPAGAPLVLPATELTFDNDVHYNVFGLRHFIDYGHYFTHAKNKNEALTALHRDLAASGALIAINHPFSSGMSLAHDFDLRAIHLLEVINAPHLADQPIDNEKAIRFFDFLWLNGHRLTAVGGSDAHKENSGGIYPLNQPITRIYCAGLSIRTLLTGLKGGQTIIDNGVNIQLTLRQALKVILPGSEVSGSVEFDAHGTDPALTWRLMRNGQCINQHTGRHVTFSVNLEPGNYCRLEARLGKQTVFFSNPVYCKLSPPEEHRFSVLRDRFLAADGFANAEMQ